MITPEPPAPAAAPHLQNPAAFRQALEQYRMNPEAQAVLDQTRLVLLTGPSSSGRNTIINRLLQLQKDDYYFVVSDTTRPPRINDGALEQNGVAYWFRSEVDMLADIKNGDFLEAELIHGQQVSGISIRELQKAHDMQRIAIADVDLGGVESIIGVKPDTIIIMVLPPDFDTWQARLRGRGTLLPEEHRRRLETAAKIFAAPKERDYFKIVVNDNLEHAVEQVDQLAHGQDLDPNQQQVAKRVAEQLLSGTRAVL